MNSNCSTFNIRNETLIFCWSIPWGFPGFPWVQGAKVQNPSCDLDSSHQLEAVCGQLLLWKWLFASKMDRAPLSASKTNLRVAASTSPHESLAHDGMGVNQNLGLTLHTHAYIYIYILYINKYIYIYYTVSTGCVFWEFGKIMRAVGMFNFWGHMCSFDPNDKRHKMALSWALRSKRYRFAQHRKTTETHHQHPSNNTKCQSRVPEPWRIRTVKSPECSCM